MLSKRESELNADAVTVDCGGCRDEYLAYVLWMDHSAVVERDKECACPVDEMREREAIADHFDPPLNFSVIPAPGLSDLDERIDYEGDFGLEEGRFLQ
jgi:hypothetical protein